MENVEISVIKLYSYIMPYLPYGNVYKKELLRAGEHWLRACMFDSGRPKLESWLFPFGSTVLGQVGNQFPHLWG